MLQDDVGGGVLSIADAAMEPLVVATRQAGAWLPTRPPGRPVPLKYIIENSPHPQLLGGPSTLNAAA